MTSLLRALCAALPVLAALATPVQAQQNPRGQISVPGEGPTVLPPPAASAPPPAPGQPQEAGIIRLPAETPAEIDAATVAEQATDPGPDASPDAGYGTALATAQSRDRGAQTARAATAPAQASLLSDGLIPLIPERMVVRDAVAGAGLPEPGIFRLTGERHSQIMTLYLPEGAPLPEKLQLMLQSSINVLPDTASLRVSINDGPEQTVPLRNIGAFAAEELSGAGLKPGLNVLRFDFRQPHRIWCGPEATFGVWTELDLIRSGARLPMSAMTPDKAGYALALRAQTGTARPLPVLVSGADTDPALLRRVTDQLAEAIGGPGQITLRSFYEPGPRAFASVALIESDKNQVTFRPGTSGALVMQIEHRPGELPELAPHLPPTPPPIAGARLLTPGRATSLAALGYSDIVGNTHYFRSDATFNLPDNWLLLANQRARLKLVYGYAAGLSKGAILLVKVNDQTVRLLPLDVKGGRVQDPLEIDFPASLLHAGLNAVRFEMMVPGDPPDAACQPRSGDMLVILDETSLNVPPSPPMELAGLIGPLGGLTSEGVRPAGDGTGAAMALNATRLAARLSRPRNADPAVRLYVTDLSTPDALPAGPQRATLRRLQKVLFPAQPATASAAPDSVALRSELPPAAPAFRLDQGSDGAALAQPTAPEAPGLSARIKAGWDTLTEGQNPITALRDTIESNAYIGSRETLDEWLDGREGMALLLRPDPAQPKDLWLIMAPRAPLDVVADHLSALRSNRLALGEAALLSPTGEWDIWAPIRPPMMTGLPALGQWRMVLGNYASWSPLLFTLVTLLVTLVSVLPALAYVLMTRTRRGGRT